MANAGSVHTRISLSGGPPGVVGIEMEGPCDQAIPGKRTKQHVLFDPGSAALPRGIPELDERSGTRSGRDRTHCISDQVCQKAESALRRSPDHVDADSPFLILPVILLTQS